MNIALVGAPGSGKTKLAHELARKMDNTCVVDDYVQAVEERSEIHIGQIIDYVGNMMVIMERYALENKARGHHDNVITCGTIFESSIYYTAHVLAFRESSTEDQAMEYAPRVDASLRMMACLYNDIMPYNHIFYLRLGTGTPDAQFIDKELQVAVAGFKLRDMVALDVETAEGQRLEKVLGVIGEAKGA